MTILKNWPLVVLISALAACNNGPKEIEPVAADPANNNLFEHNHNHDHGEDADMANAWHTVEVKEVLQAEKYSYLLVAHGSKEMWVATLRADYQPGETYRMKTGLLKTNFKSIEHNRTFPEIYLVSEIYPENTQQETSASAEEIDELNLPATKPEGVTSIADIIKSPETYAGKTVRVFGKVVKANPNIMDRNWLHLEDGTAPDFDFVLTTQSNIPVGHEVAFDGVISVNRDFGAGYTYTVMMENAKPVK